MFELRKFQSASMKHKSVLKKSPVLRLHTVRFRNGTVDSWRFKINLRIKTVQALYFTKIRQDLSDLIRLCQTLKIPCNRKAPSLLSCVCIQMRAKLYFLQLRSHSFPRKLLFWEKLSFPEFLKRFRSLRHFVPICAQSYPVLGTFILSVKESHSTHAEAVKIWEPCRRLVNFM